jgi:hypothetical protein
MQMILTTTFALLRQDGACNDRYAHLRDALRTRRHRGAIPLSLILEINGLDDALWALQTVPKVQAAARDRLARLFACDCAERVLHFFEQHHPEDGRPRAAVETARRFALGEATRLELSAASAVAAAIAVAAARTISGVAARDDSAGMQASAAASSAAWGATSVTASAAALGAAKDTAMAAASAVERAWQTERLRQYLSGEVEA